MHRNPRSGVLAGPWALDLSLTRTSVLVLGCLLAVASGLRAEVEVGEGGGLEASMRSSFLQEFQEASEGFRTETQQNPAVPGSFLDTSAVVGRLFRTKLPQQLEDVSMADVVKVSRRHFLYMHVTGGR